MQMFTIHNVWYNSISRVIGNVVILRFVKQVASSALVLHPGGRVAGETTALTDLQLDVNFFTTFIS